LPIFLILGSFGILIGTLGIGIIVYRNISEQKKEFALLQAVGIKKEQISAILNFSYLILLTYSISLGILAAVAASLPSLLFSNSDIPYFLIIVITFLILVSGMGSIYYSTKISLKGNIIELLRTE